MTVYVQYKVIIRLSEKRKPGSELITGKPFKNLENEIHNGHCYVYCKVLNHARILLILIYFSFEIKT